MTRTIVGMGLLTAVVVVLQLLGSFIKFGPFSISLVLLPIVVGAALYGVWAGAWLGFVFGMVVLLSGDAAPFFTVSPLGTVLVVLVKGAAAGACSGLVYMLLSKKLPPYVATLGAAVVCPVVNTGIFLLGCRLFFFETIKSWASGTQYAQDVTAYMFLGLVGLNFIFELVANILLSPAIVTLVRIGEKSIAKKNTPKID